MLHKRQSMVIKQRRSVASFFNRVSEVFERKFDGFPAVNESPAQTPAVQEGALGGIDYGALVDLIAGAFVEPDVSQCPDVLLENCVDDDCAGRSTTEVLVEDTGEWLTTKEPKYFTDVWIDGLKAVKDLDYTESTGKIIPTIITGPPEVMARYVIL